MGPTTWILLLHLLLSTAIWLVKLRRGLVPFDISKNYILPTTALNPMAMRYNLIINTLSDYLTCNIARALKNYVNDTRCINQIAQDYTLRSGCHKFKLAHKGASPSEFQGLFKKLKIKNWILILILRLQSQLHAGLWVCYVLWSLHTLEICLGIGQLRINLLMN